MLRGEHAMLIQSQGDSIMARPLMWLRRYLPAELVCTCTALLCTLLVSTMTESTAALALAGTWGENLGFYGVMLFRELRSRGGVRALPAAVCFLALEFGPAEALDSLLIRPALMFAGVTLLENPGLGILVGKVAADVSFYSLAIISYERLSRR
jgi:hypothetical protein